MPSTVTHAYFSMDLYDCLENEQKLALRFYKKQLKIFAQGPDILFFCNFMSLKKDQKIRQLGHYMHTHKTQAFFFNLIEHIKTNNLEKNPEIIAFLYGMISHYVLDMTVHPYVAYKTGWFDRKKRNTYKYFGGHEYMETYLDAYMIKTKDKVLPQHFASHAFCFPQVSISHNLEQVIDEVFKRTFNKRNIGHKYALSIKQMKLFYKLFKNDKTGIKKKIYKGTSILSIKMRIPITSYNIKLDRSDYYLNLSRDPWFHPLDKSNTSNYTFMELYVQALFKTLDVIKEVDKVLHNQKDLQYLYEVFPNLSYLTGYECKLGKGTYFSF